MSGFVDAMDADRFSYFELAFLYVLVLACDRMADRILARRQRRRAARQDRKAPPP